MKSSKTFLSQKDLNYLGLNDPSSISILKSPQENLSNLITQENINLGHLIELNLIYETLYKIKNFKEFILLNDFNRKEALNILKSGLIKTYNLNEQIYKKDTYPQYYYLVLVGSVSYHNQNFTPGNFFGDEIIRGVRYKYNAVSTSEQTILLLLHKDIFNLDIKSKIINANENIQKILENSFHIFKSFDDVVFHKYYKNMVKLYPFVEEVVVSDDERADAIFILYKGNCALNHKEIGDLIILDKGDIFGSESLANVDKDGNILNSKYVYNLINKAQNTIIFKFFISNLNKHIINNLKIQLATYLKERNDIIQKHKNMREDLGNRLKKKYKIFKKKENINELIHLLMYKKFTFEKAEISFNNALKIIRKNEKFENDKQKFIPNKKSFFDNTIFKNKLFKKIPRSNSFINFKDMKDLSINRNRGSIMTNLLLKKDIKKMILAQDLKKMISNQNEENKNEETHKKKNQKNQHNNNINNSFKTINADNSNNSSFFFTSVNFGPNKKNIYKKIPIISAKNKISKAKKILSKKDENEDYSFLNDFSKKISRLQSTNRGSISYRNLSHAMSAKKQIETYGCTALDTINYFNCGDKERSLKSYNSHKNFNIKNQKKCIFYRTRKYNLPLFILCNEKERIKYPEILKF